MIYFTSDWHFGHNKEFIYRPRFCESIDEMNRKIVNKYKEIITDDDDIYVLGDLMLGDNNIGIEYIKQLPGKIHVILGNHDTDTRVELYKQCSNIVSIEYATIIKINGWHIYLSHYPTITSNLDINKPLKNRMISLCGHSHSQNRFKDMDKGLIYHCELDAHNCYPISFDEIIKDIKYFISLDINDQICICKKDIY